MTAMSSVPHFGGVASALPRVVKQVFIRDEFEWSGPAARRVTVLGLHACGIQLAPDQFRAVMGGAYRLGRVLDPTPNIHPNVPWDWGFLRERLFETMGGSLSEENFEVLLSDFCGVCGGIQFNSSKGVDWIAVLNKALRRLELADVDPGLERKVAFADYVHDFLVERVDNLTSYAEEQQGVSLLEALGIMEALVEERVLALPPTDTSVQRRHTRLERLGDDDVAQMSTVVHARARRAFQAWLKNCTPQVQAAVCRRLIGLVEDSVASRIWVKSLAIRSFQLWELKVVSEGNHYRILYTLGDDDSIEVLSFGLRRDLDELIETASRINAGF